MAPGLTIGLVVPSLPRSTASSELNGRPVAFTPSFSRNVVRAELPADERENERLGDAHDRKHMLDVSGGIDAAVDAHHAYAEKIASSFCQRGIHRRDFAFDVGVEAFVRPVYERLNARRIRQTSR